MIRKTELSIRGGQDDIRGHLSRDPPEPWLGTRVAERDETIDDDAQNQRHTASRKKPSP